MVHHGARASLRVTARSSVADDARRSSNRRRASRVPSRGRRRRTPRSRCLRPRGDDAMLFQRPDQRMGAGGGGGRRAIQRGRVARGEAPPRWRTFGTSSSTRLDTLYSRRVPRRVYSDVLYREVSSPRSGITHTQACTVMCNFEPLGGGRRARRTRPRPRLAQRPADIPARVASSIAVARRWAGKASRGRGPEPRFPDDSRLRRRDGDETRGRKPRHRDDPLRLPGRAVGGRTAAALRSVASVEQTWIRVVDERDRRTRCGRTWRLRRRARRLVRRRGVRQQHGRVRAVTRRMAGAWLRGRRSTRRCPRRARIVSAALAEGRVAVLGRRRRRRERVGVRAALPRRSSRETPWTICAESDASARCGAEGRVTNLVRRDRRGTIRAVRDAESRGTHRARVFEEAFVSQKVLKKYGGRARFKTESDERNECAWVVQPVERCLGFRRPRVRDGDATRPSYILGQPAAGRPPTTRSGVPRVGRPRPPPPSQHLLSSRLCTCT